MCTKNEASSEWLVIAQDLQDLGLRAHWSPEAWLAVNPDVTECRAGNDIPLTYPIDFERLRSSIAGMKKVDAEMRGGHNA